MTTLDSITDHSAVASDSGLSRDYVTVSVGRDVIAGHEGEYERWISGVTTESSRFAGHLGINVLVPAPGSRRYTIIYRFDNMSHAQAWQQSTERRLWMAKIDGIVEGEAEFKTATGLEAWFQFPQVTANKQPVKWRMSAVLILVVYNLIIALNYLLEPWIGEWSIHSRTAVVVALQVLLMTYLVMPRVTHYIKGWLYV
jgi:antibiotic biosynthesis monooxygenase (ABM) superfamily enzyme